MHPKDTLKYLGVILDKGLSFGKHLIYAADKANTSAAALSRIMPRMGGSGEAKRKTLASVVESVLYATPIWGHVLKVQKYRQIAMRAQRKMALIICRGYRTTSTKAANVLARVIPIDLLAEERKEIIGKTEAQKKEERKNTIAKRQERWAISTEDIWLHRVIPDIRLWYYRKHGEITYHLTQILTSHGCFQKYLQRIGKAETDLCLYCHEEPDDACHTAFACPRWRQNRERAEAIIDCRLTSENIIENMLMDEWRWTCIANMIGNIMRKKEEDGKTGVYEYNG